MFAFLRKRILGIAPVEITFARRGFTGGEAAHQARLERIGGVFVAGYHAALETHTSAALAGQLAGIPAEFRGFAFEGAAMGLALLDFLTPWQRHRVRRFLDGPGGAHVYMIHVGVGWALARLWGSVDRALARMDPLLGWLAVDGYGFHEGFFHWPHYLHAEPPPSRLRGYARRVFDQGLGRSLWFVHGADVELMAATAARFPAGRQKDLWSGIGLACAYAGEVNEP